MMIEDEEPKRPQPRLARPPLATWSESELQAYIVELRGEIGRAEQEIADKQRHRTTADAVFRRAQTGE